MRVFAPLASEALVTRRMTGSVLFLEWLRACTRRKHHRLREVYFGVLTMEAGLFLALFTSRSYTASPLAALELAFRFLQILAMQHFTLALLLPPAFVAGAIADEKSRGTLSLLLSTPLTPGEIVVGKWLGQVLQMLILALPALPLFFLTTLLSGVPPSWLLAGAALTVLIVTTMAAAGMLASVLCRKTATAVLTSYAVFGVFATSVWMLEEWQGWSALAWLSADTLLQDGMPIAPVLLLLVSCLALMGCCLALAAWQLRPASQRHLEARPPRRWLEAWWPRPRVSETQPLRWKERFAGELGGLSFLRRVPQHWRKAGVFAISLVLSFTLAALEEDLLYVQAVAYVVVLSLVVAARAAGAICGEREKQTWDLILSSPLTPYAIVRGKLWGIIDSARLYMVSYLAPVLLAALWCGPATVIWVIYWWLAAWIAMYFLGAVGIRCSASAQGTWQSLLKTFAMAGWLMLQRWFFFLLPLAFCINLVALFRSPRLVLAPALNPAGGSIASFIVIYVLMSYFFMVLFAKTEQILQQAEQIIDDSRIPENMLATLRRRITGESAPAVVKESGSRHKTAAASEK
jgi:ABC-type transport system involved in multi-copper enzyme maturation permease subunit